MITIIDYGMGNIGSMENMIKKVGGFSVTTDAPEGIANADKLILPGVGSFDQAMKKLEGIGLRPD
jgi:glutamine amidotransferase